MLRAPGHSRWDEATRSRVSGPTVSWASIREIRLRIIGYHFDRPRYSLLHVDGRSRERASSGSPRVCFL